MLKIDQKSAERENMVTLVAFNVKIEISIAKYFIAEEKLQFYYIQEKSHGGSRAVELYTTVTLLSTLMSQQ